MKTIHSVTDFHSPLHQGKGTGQSAKGVRVPATRYHAGYKNVSLNNQLGMPPRNACAHGYGIGQADVVQEG